MVIIDVPIGLPESGRRACDLEARTRLGRRWMTVFTGARRPLLSMASWEEANVWGKQDGEGVTKQLFGILPKIREVDAYIASARNLTFREGHPELSFYAAAGRPMEYNKKKAEGRDERLAALTSFIHGTMVREWLDRTRGSGAARDDILDALALCRSAGASCAGLSRHSASRPAPGHRRLGDGDGFLTGDSGATASRCAPGPWQPPIRRPCVRGPWVSALNPAGTTTYDLRTHKVTHASQTCIQVVVPSGLAKTGPGFTAQLRTASRNFKSRSIIRSDTGLPLGPTLPARRSRMNRSQSRWESVAGFRSLPKHPRNILIAALSCSRDCPRLGGRHLFTVDVKKRSQGERLGLGVRLAVELRPEVAGGELVRLPLRPSPVAVLQRPAEPAPVLAPLDLEQAGLGIGKDPYPVPAPFAGAVAAPDRFRACHHSIPLSMMDCTICALETSPRRCFSTSSGVAGAWVFRGRCERAILGAPGLPVLGILPSRTRRPRWSAE